MELTHGSEMSANYILTPGKYPKEPIQYSNHGESLKSRIITSYFNNKILKIKSMTEAHFKFSQPHTSN
jgi:hypothetical protein